MVQRERQSLAIKGRSTFIKIKWTSLTLSGEMHILKMVSGQPIPPNSWYQLQL
jgi:hypothetical protein